MQYYHFKNIQSALKVRKKKLDISGVHQSSVPAHQSLSPIVVTPHPQLSPRREREVSLCFLPGSCTGLSGDTGSLHSTDHVQGRTGPESF